MTLRILVEDGVSTGAEFLWEGEVFGIGEKVDDPLQMYLSDIYTVAVNLAGIPGISVPCGHSSDGLPVGLQLLAPPFAEQRLFRAAYVVEQST